MNYIKRLELFILQWCIALTVLAQITVFPWPAHLTEKKRNIYTNPKYKYKRK